MEDNKITETNNAEVVIKCFDCNTMVEVPLYGDTGCCCIGQRWSLSRNEDGSLKSLADAIEEEHSPLAVATKEMLRWSKYSGEQSVKLAKAQADCDTLTGLIVMLQDKVTKEREESEERAELLYRWLLQGWKAEPEDKDGLIRETRVAINVGDDGRRSIGR